MPTKLQENEAKLKLEHKKKQWSNLFDTPVGRNYQAVTDTADRMFDAGAPAEEIISAAFAATIPSRNA
jgi:hypothetical protein